MHFLVVWNQNKIKLNLNICEHPQTLTKAYKAQFTFYSYSIFFLIIRGGPRLWSSPPACLLIALTLSHSFWPGVVFVARKFGKYFITSFISKIVHLMRVVTFSRLFTGSESELSSSSSICEGCKPD